MFVKTLRLQKLVQQGEATESSSTYCGTNQAITLGLL